MKLNPRLHLSLLKWNVPHRDSGSLRSPATRFLKSLKQSADSAFKTFGVPF